MEEFTGNGTPLSTGGFGAALDVLGAPHEALWAVLSVETSGCGYLDDRRPKILFERHYFHRLTHGKFDRDHPDISAPTPGGYGDGGAHQYDRLAAAIALDRDAALQSASWGIGQIMGANFDAAGFGSAEEMVTAFVTGEDAQLAGMARFMAHSGMKTALSAGKWATLARQYNGKDYAKHRYDEKLGTYFTRFKTHGCPDIDVRAAQAYLTYKGDDPGGIDGILGQQTTDALKAFQAANGLPADGKPTDATLAKLAGV
ncbi:MAG TPA: N-acetylmuramidase domain-containing protein [Allosphingosinicella sp.]|jgi:hypothetical protein